MVTEQQKVNAWLKAQIHPDYPQGNVRIDAYGATMVWVEYGLQSDFGWEIDHELPKSLFESLARASGNQRALHWRNNRAKSDKIDINSILR